MNRHEQTDRICARQTEDECGGYVIIGGFVVMVALIFLYAYQPAKETVYPEPQHQIQVHNVQETKS